MTKGRKLGICMDHAHATLIEYSENPMETAVVTSDFTHQEKEETLAKSEYGMHKKEQQGNATFYKHLGEVIRDFEEVLLFGPTNAKSELYNLLKADHRFEQIVIEVKNTDKLSDSQQHTFVKEYFSARQKGMASAS